MPKKPPQLDKKQLPVDKKGMLNYKRKMWDLKHPKGKSQLIEMTQEQYDNIFGKENKMDTPQSPEEDTGR